MTRRMTKGVVIGVLKNERFSDFHQVIVQLEYQVVHFNHGVLTLEICANLFIEDKFSDVFSLKTSRKNHKRMS